MKKQILIILVLLATILSANRCENKKTVQSLFDDVCPLSYKVEWTIVEEGISVDKQIELLSKLSAAAEVDVNKINNIIGKAKANAELETSFELSKAIKSETVRKAEVTQDVFDEYIRIRTASCNIWDGINNGIYGTDEKALKEARQLFTDIQKKFAQLEEKKEPKLIIDKAIDSLIYFSISNLLNNNIYLTVTDIEVEENINNPAGGESIVVERYKLPHVYLSGENNRHDLLADSLTLKLPPNDVVSFYFKLIDMADYLHRISVSLKITYIDPETGNKKWMDNYIIIPKKFR